MLTKDQPGGSSNPKCGAGIGGVGHETTLKCSFILQHRRLKQNKQTKKQLETKQQKHTPNLQIFLFSHRFHPQGF